MPGGDSGRTSHGLGLRFEELSGQARAAIEAFVERWEQEEASQLDRLLG